MKRLMTSFVLLMLMHNIIHAQTCHNGICYPPASRTVLGPVRESAVPTPHCRIHVADGTTGSGTLIAQNDATGLVLTCSHLFDQSASNIVVAFADGGRYGARLLDRDRANDLAALLIKRPNTEPIAVHDEEPSGMLTACGYGPNGIARQVRAAISGSGQAIGATYPSMKIAGVVRPGDSGGGVLDSTGRIVGVIWGCRDGETYLTCGRPLREFLDRVWPERRGRRSEFRDPESNPLTPNPQPPTPSPDLTARLEKIETDISELRTNKQDRGDYLRVGDLNGYAKSTDIPAFKAIYGQIEERIGNAQPGLLGGMSVGKVVAGALGLSSPLALAAIIACGLAGRRWKSRESRVKSREPAAHSGSRPSTLDSRPVPIAVDSPPPPLQIVPETHFVPVEKDDFARAHQWASTQVARKYPGATELLSTLDSLIKQQLAGTKG